jgi:hypothetical protein
MTLSIMTVSRITLYIMTLIITSNNRMTLIMTHNIMSVSERTLITMKQRTYFPVFQARLGAYPKSGPLFG